MRVFFIFPTSNSRLSLRSQSNLVEAWSQDDSKQVVSNSRARS
jgi:hypothetical protein